MPDPKTGSPAPDKESEGMAEALRRIEKAKREKATILDLSRLGLTAVPKALGQLTALTRLDLDNNRLTTLPEALGHLTNLEILYVFTNRLTALPEALGQLTELYLLQLSENKLTSLPEALRKLTELERLYLHGNPGLGLPDEVLGSKWGERGTPARPTDILAYYFKARKAAAPLNEVKMLLVGRGEAGKSSIRDCLLGFGFDPKKKETPGIEIHTWPLKQGGETVRLHVWDFAGQELTHGTHQFFLTERSVYVLVLDARADTQEADAEYWLRLVSAFGGDSPVIVALNKWKSKPFDVDRFAIRERFPAVRAFIETDCKTGLGLAELEKEIRATVADMKSVREPFPAEWTETKNAFSKMRKSYVPFEKFRDQCARRGVKKAEDQESLARILHRLGIVLHYADDPRLRDTTVLKPHWVTESIYALLRLKEGPKSDGSLTFAEAGAALPKEKPEMVRYLIGLMRRFELCFPVDETEERWLVPELLPKFQPELGKEWQAADALRLRYKYKVLPEGLLPRFITRTYPLSAGQLRWRGGVVLEMDGAQALVRAGGPQVNAAIIGDDEGRQRLAKLIRNHFAHIHADLKGLEPEELVEVEGHPGNFKSVATLERDEQKPGAVTTIETKEGSVPIDQTRELNRISAPAARDPQQRRLRLFLSYSHKDAGLRDVFQENLALLEQDGLLEWWFDGKILPSAEWDKEIRSELEKADIIVFLVSTTFLNSKYIRGVEMTRAVERRKASETELVSVILEDCVWKEREFTKYQLVQPGGKPVRGWNRHRNAFNDVEKALRKVVAQILAKGGGHGGKEANR
jgi:internalin A